MESKASNNVVKYNNLSIESEVNTITIGAVIDAITEPRDTYLVITMKMTPINKQINPVGQLSTSNTPKDVATPFPPLNPKNTGKLCPKTTKMLANKPPLNPNII